MKIISRVISELLRVTEAHPMIKQNKTKQNTSLSPLSAHIPHFEAIVGIVILWGAFRARGLKCNSTGSPLQLHASEWQMGCREGGGTGGGERGSGLLEKGREV